MLFLFVPRLLSRGSQRVGTQLIFVSKHTSWITCLWGGALTLLEPIFWAACQAVAYAFQVGYVTPRTSRGLSSCMSRPRVSRGLSLSLPVLPAGGQNFSAIKGHRDQCHLWVLGAGI